ncbi:uncharacterized protein [Lolium perenne]|uniref:uncharacterized protein n=1 Tax=Lolium perenne TaxID=4522 RepID=UPI0021F60C82|nr:uncharacterized protein LOC127310166 [Lolium perenne]
MASWLHAPSWFVRQTRCQCQCQCVVEPLHQLAIEAPASTQLRKVADQYGSNIKIFPRLAGLGRFAILAEGDDVVALGKEGGGPPPTLNATVVDEASLASGETLSQITEVVGSGMRSSPTVEPASPTWTSSEMVVDAPAASVAASGVTAGQGSGPALDLHGEVTAAVSLVQGRRTKVVPVAGKGPARATKKTAIPATPVRKSSRTAGTAATSMLKKAQNLAATKNLELPPVTVLEGSGQTEGPSDAGRGSGKRQETLRATTG